MCVVGEGGVRANSSCYSVQVAVGVFWRGGGVGGVSEQDRV